MDEKTEAKIKLMEEQVKQLKEVVSSKRAKAESISENTIQRKAAAAESHIQILAGRNIGVVGIGSVVLTLMVAMINNIAASVTAFVCVGVLGFMVAMRVKAAQYLEQKYGLEAKPIFVPPEKKGGFTV